MSNVIDGDSIPEVKAIYQRMTAEYGPNWYFNHKATNEKNIEMTKLRANINALIGDRNTLATAETGLVMSSDKCVLALPEAWELFERTQLRKDEFRYPNKQSAELIRQYYADWAKQNRWPIFSTIEDAVLTLLNSYPPKSRW